MLRLRWECGPSKPHISDASPSVNPRSLDYSPLSIFANDFDTPRLELSTFLSFASCAAREPLRARSLR